MGVAKQYLKTKPVCKVTFTVPAKDAEKVSVIGDFNDWDASKGELKKLKNGNFKGTFELPKDNSFEFKYVIDGEQTEEPEADGKRWNDYAGRENPLLVV